MRKITAGRFISLDGVVEAPDQWHFSYFNDEMGAAVDSTLGATELDELHLLVHPISVRNGMRLFDEGEPPIPFTLSSSQIFKTVC
jgi:hypothetical protein